uniref:Integrase catalytic domain-containing protein n=1 Tax=Oryzias latipes TaxID=8090 RepID=A0A3P9MD94_ORYLA
MSQITTQATITRLRRLFSSFGLPEQIVTDNATTFTSAEFKTFVKMNGIHHTTSAPGHPASNGLAERYVQTFKAGMKRLAHTHLCIDDKISFFLLQYRSTPHCTTGQSPADLFLRRHIRTSLDFLQPCTKERVRKRQYHQKDCHDYSAADRSFAVEDAVYLRSTVSGGHIWIPGMVVRQTGPVSYKVREWDSGTVHRRHGDQLRERAVPAADQVVSTEEAGLEVETSCGSSPQKGDFPNQSPEPVVLRRSQREIKRPLRFQT